MEHINEPPTYFGRCACRCGREVEIGPSVRPMSDGVICRDCEDGEHLNYKVTIHWRCKRLANQLTDMEEK